MKAEENKSDKLKNEQIKTENVKGGGQSTRPVEMEEYSNAIFDPSHSGSNPLEVSNPEKLEVAKKITPKKKGIG